MRKVLISAILAASTLAIAAPAAAQWAPSYGNQYGGQYGGQYGNGYGTNDYGQSRQLMYRLNRLEQQINQLDRRNMLSEREAGRLRYQANMIERQLRQASYNGLNGYERRNIEIGIARLEQTIRYEANDGNRWGQRDDQRGWNDRQNWQDRDRDGRNDRYEDDQGRQHDD